MSEKIFRIKFNFTYLPVDKPDRPEAIAVKEFKKDSVIVEWKPPVDDGGLEITKYSLEKCDPEKNVWIKVAELEKTIDSYCVQKLIANAQYIFRVMALNAIGVSEPIESEPITIKVKIGKLLGDGLVENIDIKCYSLESYFANTSIDQLV